jgi:hypothetical protein
MPEWGPVTGLPDRRCRGRERIPFSILDGEKLWKGERRKQRTTACVRVGGAKRLRRSRWELRTYKRPSRVGCAG